MGLSNYTAFTLHCFNLILKIVLPRLLATHKGQSFQDCWQHINARAESLVLRMSPSALSWGLRALKWTRAPCTPPQLSTQTSSTPSQGRSLLSSPWSERESRSPLNTAAFSILMCTKPLGLDSVCHLLTHVTPSLHFLSHLHTQAESPSPLTATFSFLPLNPKTSWLKQMIF